MIDTQIAHATCHIKCGEESGTGWLISGSRVITACHCVHDAIDEKAEINVCFNGIAHNVIATVIDTEIALDICLLQLEREIDTAPIVLDAALPREGARFTAFGFPMAKLSVGHRLEGLISQVLGSPKLGIDLDLNVEAGALTAYQGISGAALMCDGRCQGMLRLGMDKSLGAISIAKASEFLRRNSIAFEDAPRNFEMRPLASRDEFTKEFDLLISTIADGYAFIEGAHGIGKSTFCDNYQPSISTLEHFGTYSFTLRSGARSHMHLAQPDIFFDWLNTLVSLHLTGKAGRISEKRYSELIVGVHDLLTALAQAYSSQGKIGVIFIDGLDEVAKLGQGILETFIGLLPQKMPSGLRIVISAPSYVQLSEALGARMTSHTCIQIPGLKYKAAQAFCSDALLPERVSFATIRIICDRAQGHALYLRYLIDLANGGADDGQLAALPLINGVIRNYYESLWPQLLADPNAVNLLAIIARLRWGIPTTQLAEILNDAERAVLVTTLERIRHLLLRPAETTIYHMSFADFLIEKTALRDLDIQHRLAEYCASHPENRYGILNAVYHGLKSSSTDEARAIISCNQEWVDLCVTEGSEPDTLISDVNEALAAATKQGNFLEVIRLFLLIQRIQFRYDTLFALSADLAASALVALGKTKEAVKHVLRHGRLIVPPDLALRLAHKLIKTDVEAALDLLDKIDAVLDKHWAKEGLTIDFFMTLHELRTQVLILRELSGDEAASQELLQLNLFSIKVIRDSVEPEQGCNQLLSEALSSQFGAAACLLGKYLPLSALRENHEGSITELYQVILNFLSSYFIFCAHYGLAHDRRLLSAVFNDIQILLDERHQGRIPPSLDVIDAMISLGAPTTILINLVSPPDNLAPLQFVAADNVSVDRENFALGMARWRLAALLDHELPCPATSGIQPNEWSKGVESLCRALAWCDGAARRAKYIADATSLRSVWEILEQRVFAQLRFTLAQRSQWESSYAVPEAIFPEVYERLTGLIADAFPEYLNRVLSFVEELFPRQCGLYSEGFRAILEKVIVRLTSLALNTEIEDQVFTLLKRWRNFIQSNVKNRHELVPELLTIIPLFVRLGATEEAHRTYQAVLSCSMGPSWYKEDQLSLMTTALQCVPQDEPIEEGILSRVAGCLEAASGEMTFQRFVRYEKAELLGILCGREQYLKAARYFLRQSCGTAEELLAEATSGEIDQIAPLKGMRFPGGALDEQDAIYRMLKSAVAATDWPICWALLEVYQFGDKRHLQSSAKAYALLAEQVGKERGALAMMVERLLIICEGEFNVEQREEFVSTLRTNLPPHLLPSFEEVLGNPPEPTNELSPTAADGAAFARNYSKSNHVEAEVPDESIKNALVMPGMFGTLDSSRESENAVARAERQLARGNTSAARTEALVALQALQHGGWSIWGNHSSSADRAETILCYQAESTEIAVKLYAPLILAERHLDPWRLAAHLIRRLSGIATHEARAGLVRLVIEHIETLVGDTVEYTSEYEFLEATYEQDASSNLMELLLAAIDHPQWLRRDKAAELILWLLDAHPRYIPIVGPLAFSMASSNLPDVLCGVLDHLSMANPIELWDRLTPALDMEMIQTSCKHIGRLGLLVRIAERATLRGSKSGEATLKAIRAIPTQSTGEGSDGALRPVQCPSWALTCQLEWKELTVMGLATQALVERAAAVLQETCAPLSIETFLELEHLLARGFGDDSKHSLGRWKAKVRHALQVAMFPQAPSALLPKILEIFRVYNPSQMNHLRILGYSSPSLTWLNALSGIGGGFEPAIGNDIYLDFFERVWDGDRYRSLRMTAFLYPSNERPLPPTPIAEFPSTQLPASKAASESEACTRVQWRPAFFGSFTPAAPSAMLMRLTNATTSDIARAYWRIGRTRSSRGGGPLNEGCFLAIKRSALRLPKGVNMAWLYETDGQVHGIISRSI